MSNYDDKSLPSRVPVLGFVLSTAAVNFTVFVTKAATLIVSRYSHVDVVTILISTAAQKFSISDH